MSNAHWRHGIRRSQLAALGRGEQPVPQRDRRPEEGDRRPGEERRTDEEAQEDRALLAEQLGQDQHREDDRDEVAGVPHAATRRDPPHLRPEAEQQDEAEPVPQAGDADPARDPPCEQQPDRGQGGVDARLPRVGVLCPHGRDQRHQDEGGERGERDIDAARGAVDHVVRAKRSIDPHPAVEERVGEVEEVPATCLERLVRQPVDEEGGDRDADADQRRDPSMAANGGGGHDEEGSVSASTAGFGTRRSREYPRLSSQRPSVIRMNGRHPTSSDRLIG